MRTDTKKYAQEVYDIVKFAAEKIGSRLPGSEGERKFADFMGDKLREIGIEPKKEEFAVSPRASIGGIPYAGFAGLILCTLTYFALNNVHLWFLMAFISIAITLWLIFSVFLYKTWFDMFFKQKVSQNVYGELLPADGKFDYTIVLSGHTDTSWNWKHSEHAYKFRDNPTLGAICTYIKVGFGAVCFFLMAGISVYMSMAALGIFHWPGNTFLLLLHFIPMICAIGCCFIIMWADPDPDNASRGAMDNATGCALAYETVKYFKENPEKAPKNCRLIAFNCGSEEAGLRGSIAFTRQHKGEPILQNCWNINIDSVADDDYFEVVIKDDWQFTRFDRDLEQMFKDSFSELGISSKTGGCIHNPVGGCDSTPMTKAGVKSVTFAAQNPILTYYYHTFRDMPERFSVETEAKGLNVILSVIEKIDAFNSQHSSVE